jgi:hypothetical protein
MGGFSHEYVFKKSPRKKLAIRKTKTKKTLDINEKM